MRAAPGGLLAAPCGQATPGSRRPPGVWELLALVLLSVLAAGSVAGCAVKEAAPRDWARSRVDSIAGALQAGFGRAALLDGWTGLTPMASYGPFPSRAVAVREPVYARAMLLDNGRTRIAIVSCDLLIAHQDLRAAVEEELRRRGVRQDGLLLAATHTHTSVGGFVDHKVAEGFMLGWFDPGMLPHLATRIADAVAAAAADLAPARLGAGRTQAPGLAVNRRIGSFTDPEVGILKVTDPTGKPRGVLVSFAAHPVLEPNDQHIAPDYPGRLAKLLDERHGFGLFLAGALGDVNARLVEAPDVRGSGAASIVADRLAGAVGQALAGIATRGDIELGLTQTLVDLGPVNPGPIPDILWPLDWLVARLLGWPRLAPVQALRIGDLAIVALASEATVRLGLQIQRLSPAPFLMVVTHANAYVGYAIEAPNYALSHLDPTSVVSLHGSRHGTRIVESARRLLEELWGVSIDAASPRLTPAGRERLEREGSGLAPESRESLRRYLLQEETEHAALDLDSTHPQSAPPLPLLDIFELRRLSLTAAGLYLDSVRIGRGAGGRRRDLVARAALEAGAGFRLAMEGGFFDSDWVTPDGSGQAQGARDIRLALSRWLEPWRDDAAGAALRLAPAVIAELPTGDFDLSAPYALSGATGVLQAGGGVAAELVWASCHRLLLEAVAKGPLDWHDGRRPGERVDLALRYAERHGLVSLHLGLCAALQLADRRRGGRVSVDRAETSWDLSLEPGMTLHLGRRLELFGVGFVPVARGGESAAASAGGGGGLAFGF